MKGRMKDAGFDVAESVAAGKIAELLVEHAPEKALEFAKNPGKILGFKIPAEWATTLGGGVVGATIAEALERLVPGIGKAAGNRIQRLAIAVGEEMDDVIKRKKMEAGSSGRGERGVSMKRTNIWYHKPGCGYVVLSDCPTHCEEIAAGSGWRQIPLLRIVQSGLQAPVPKAGDFCACPIALEEDMFETSGMGAKPKADPASGKVRPSSFATLLGRALQDPNRKLKAEALRKLVASSKLSDKQCDMLEQCDTLEELDLLMACASKEELIALLPTLVAKEERGMVGKVGHEGALLLAAGGDTVRKEIAKAEKRGTESAKALEVSSLCLLHKTNRQEVAEALTLAGQKVSVETLTIQDVVAATTHNPATGCSLIAAYRQQKQQRKASRKPVPSKWRRMLWG
jgi:hypothetical protein